MASKTVPLSQLSPVASAASHRAVAAKPLPERLSLRTCVILIAAVSTLLWIGIGLIADKLIG